MAQKTSKQLLYAEKFEGTPLERKLQIVGKKQFGKPCIPPPSAVLQQVKALLPKLQAANEELKSLPQDDLDIEHISPDYQGPVVEMNLALVPNKEDSDSGAWSSSDDDSDDNSDEDKEKGGDDNDNKGPSISDLMAALSKQRKGKKRPLVEEADDDNDEDDNKGEDISSISERMVDCLGDHDGEDDDGDGDDSSVADTPGYSQSKSRKGRKLVEDISESPQAPWRKDQK